MPIVEIIVLQKRFAESRLGERTAKHTSESDTLRHSECTRVRTSASSGARHTHTSRVCTASQPGRNPSVCASIRTYSARITAQIVPVLAYSPPLRSPRAYGSPLDCQRAPVRSTEPCESLRPCRLLYPDCTHRD